MALLFAVARFGDARADAGKSIITANVYALSLAVYCTSWTFYGSVGRATSGGLSFLTIYIGPTLMLLMTGSEDTREDTTPTTVKGSPLISRVPPMGFSP